MTVFSKNVDETHEYPHKKELILPLTQTVRPKVNLLASLVQRSGKFPGILALGKHQSPMGKYGGCMVLSQRDLQQVSQGHSLGIPEIRPEQCVFLSVFNQSLLHM